MNTKQPSRQPNGPTTRFDAKRTSPAAKSPLPLPLPNERDESVNPTDAPRSPDMLQAAKDIADGKVDTDNYTRVGEAHEHAMRKKTR